LSCIIYIFKCQYFYDPLLLWDLANTFESHALPLVTSVLKQNVEENIWTYEGYVRNDHIHRETENFLYDMVLLVLSNKGTYSGLCFNFGRETENAGRI
jgi:hypothetical protein